MNQTALWESRGKKDNTFWNTLVNKVEAFSEKGLYLDFSWKTKNEDGHADVGPFPFCFSPPYCWWRPCVLSSAWLHPGDSIDKNVAPDLFGWIKKIECCQNMETIDFKSFLCPLSCHRGDRSGSKPYWAFFEFLVMTRHLLKTPQWTPDVSLWQDSSVGWFHHLFGTKMYKKNEHPLYSTTIKTYQNHLKNPKRNLFCRFDRWVLSSYDNLTGLGRPPLHVVGHPLFLRRLRMCVLQS